MRFTLQGDSNAVGALARSVNGKYVTLAGYTAAVGANAEGTDARVVARVNGAGTVDTSTTLGKTFGASKIRGAVTNDGSGFWVTGNGNTEGSTPLGGMVYQPLGATGTPTVIVSKETTGSSNKAFNNFRTVQAVGGNLYTASEKGTAGVYQVAGLPTKVTTPSALVTFSGEIDAISELPLEHEPGSGKVDLLYVVKEKDGIIQVLAQRLDLDRTRQSRLRHLLRRHRQGRLRRPLPPLRHPGESAANTVVTLTDSAAFNAAPSASATKTVAHRPLRDRLPRPRLRARSRSDVARSADRRHRDRGQRESRTELDRARRARRLGDHRVQDHPLQKRRRRGIGPDRLDGDRLHRRRPHQRQPLHLHRGGDQRRRRRPGLGPLGRRDPGRAGCRGADDRAFRRKPRGHPGRPDQPDRAGHRRPDRHPGRRTDGRRDRHQQSLRRRHVSGVTVSGSGATRTVSVTPAGGTGLADITLRVTGAEGKTATVTLHYAASAASATPATTRYHTGAADGSAAIDVGDGYMLIGDDENNILRLYQDDVSGAPVKEWNFNSLMGNPEEIDIEAAARAGNTIYWTGSMGNSKKGNLKPDRSTLFTTHVTW